MGDFFLVLIIGRLRVPVPTGYGTDLNIGRLKVPVIQRWVQIEEPIMGYPFGYTH